MSVRLFSCALLFAVSACSPQQPSLTSAQVEQFVRDYVAATNSADGSKIMSMVLRDSPSSIAGGKIDRGWDAIRVSTDASLEKRKGKIVLDTFEVTPLSADAAVAVGTLNVQGVRQVGNLIVDNLPGAFTMVVKRTPNGVQLVHEHYSIRTK